MSNANQSHPWAGNPRVFRAAAMPNGDARFGIAGELVFLCEKRGHCTDKVKYLSRAEAEQLRGEIDNALKAFDLARGLAVSVASRSPYPFRDHRSLAEVEAG
jgi:hypothetical protein